MITVMEEMIHWLGSQLQMLVSFKDGEEEEEEARNEIQMLHCKIYNHLLYAANVKYSQILY